MHPQNIIVMSQQQSDILEPTVDSKSNKTKWMCVLITLLLLIIGTLLLKMFMMQKAFQFQQIGSNNTKFADSSMKCNTSLTVQVPKTFIVSQTQSQIDLTLYNNLMNQYKAVLNKYNQLVASNNSHSQPQNCSQLQYKNKKLNSNLKQLESRYIQLDNLYKLQQNKTKTMQDQVMQVRNALKNQNPKQNDDCKYALNVQTIMLKTQLEIKRNNQNQLKKYLGSTPYIIFEGEHYFDYKLSQILNQFYRQENIKSVGDLGCGKCQYIIKLHQNGFQAKGYDGNPLANHSIVQKKDLSQIQNLDMQFDFIQSFEVGQHIFSEYQNNFIFNLCRHAKKGIVMSWAALGQGGFMHVNNRNQQYLIPKIQMHGFKYNKEKSDWFKSHHELALYFQSNIMVFYRQ